MVETTNRWLDMTFGKSDDSEILKARKRIVVSMQLVGLPLAIGFIIFFFAFSNYFLLPGFFVIIYLIQVGLGLVLLAKTKRFEESVWFFISAVIIMALGIHIVQGGFYNSSGTLLYAFIAPAFASIGLNQRIGIRVLLLYFGLIILVFLLNSEISKLGPSFIPEKIIFSLVAINLCATGFFVFSLLVLFIGEIDVALDKADRLLLNILPKNIAFELKKKGFVEAKKYESVTVLFSDFKSFTELSENTSPEKVVRSIDFYYRNFDRIISEYGLEKIKTIGDSYMCAGGVPEISNQHGLDAIAAAKEMIAFVKKEQESDQDIIHFEIRIGIHTGPAVAGIVGSKKWQYDIWGDTVNIASRMEAMSEPGKINISESTFKEVEHHTRCSYRGELNVKGKGNLKMYFVD